MNKHKIIIGPKAYRSNLPCGEITSHAARMLELAESGHLQRGTFDFNVKIKDLSKEEAVYVRAHVLNGKCYFKRYTAADRLKYAIAQLFVFKRRENVFKDRR